MSTPTWISAHLFYHNDHAPLLTACVQPLVNELAEQRRTQRYFFIRYWQGGPHVRLRLLPAHPADATAIRAQVSAHAVAFFAAQPSQTALQRSEYAALTKHLSEHEYGAARRAPLYPNNSLRYIRYRPEYERYGGALALSHVERHFMDSSALAIELLSAAPTLERRIGQALTFMLSAMRIAADQAATLAELFARSYRFWANMLGAARTAYEAHFAERYVAVRTRLLPLAEHLTARVDQSPAGTADSPLARWQASMQLLYTRLSELSARDEISFGTEPAPVASMPLHQPHAATIMQRCLHMHNNRLGIPFSDEVYLNYVLARLLTELAPQRQHLLDRPVAMTSVRKGAS